MPNWCSNSVNFYGGDLKALKHELIKGITHNQQAGEGWLPDYLKDTGERYLFDIDITVGEENRLYMLCETKWSPANDELEAIAKRYGCDFTNYYEECGNGVYGEYIYEYGSGIDYYLDQQDIDKVEYDEDKDIYTFEGKEYESSYDCYEILLDRKRKGGKE